MGNPKGDTQEGLQVVTDARTKAERSESQRSARSNCSSEATPGGFSFSATAHPVVLRGTVRGSNVPKEWYLALFSSSHEPSSIRVLSPLYYIHYQVRYHTTGGYRLNIGGGGAALPVGE